MMTRAAAAPTGIRHDAAVPYRMTGEAGEARTAIPGQRLRLLAFQPLLHRGDFVVQVLDLGQQLFDLQRDVARGVTAVDSVRRSVPGGKGAPEAGGGRRGRRRGTAP